MIEPKTILKSIKYVETMQCSSKQAAALLVGGVCVDVFIIQLSRTTQAWRIRGILGVKYI